MKHRFANIDEPITQLLLGAAWDIHKQKQAFRELFVYPQRWIAKFLERLHEKFPRKPYDYILREHVESDVGLKRVKKNKEPHHWDMRRRMRPSPVPTDKRLPVLHTA